VEKLFMYVQVHQLRKQGFSIAAIAKRLEVSRNTVYKYLDMSFEEANQWVNTLSRRTKKLDPHRDQILNWLREYPDLSSSQIQDWLKEKWPSLNIGGSTVRTYVAGLRNDYHIPRMVNPRSYEAVEELPMGKQMQVDFGQVTVKTPEGKEVKLTFIGFVLSHSRNKYAVWQDRPFTTRDVIRCHEEAFQYFGGMTEEIVYDQDHLIAVSENAGDLLLTGDFLSYQQERGFRIYLCRKSDPESKGKIENVVKFIKNNFAKHRRFLNIEKWNEQCEEWFERTGNYQVHNTTKKRPSEVHALEKQHLQPVSPILSFESTHASIIARTIHKDNVVKYKSNRYSVPVGTYRSKGDNQVYLRVVEEKLIIEASPKGDIIAVHPLHNGKGQLIKNHHHTRDRSKGIQAFMDTIEQQFENKADIRSFLLEIRARYPRYIRDQLQLTHRSLHQFRHVADDALHICIKDHLWSANDLYDIAKHLSQTNKQQTKQKLKLEVPAIDSQLLKAKAETRPMVSYLEILGGDA
jgi:transposase